MSPNTGRKTADFIGQSGNSEQGGWLHKNMNNSTSPSRGRLRSNRFGDKKLRQFNFCHQSLSQVFVTNAKCATRETYIESVFM